ncbi:MAG: hypothetical protein DIKNOCCD_02290 [bacterium]|nr:hypothetical protein [bacterium]
MSLIDRQKWNRWKNIWLVAPSVPSYYQRCGRLATGADNHWNEHENPLRGCNVGSGRGGCQGFPGAMNVWECGGIFRSAVGLSGRHECRPYTRLFLPALPVGRGVASFSPSLHCHSHSLRCLSRPPHSSFPRKRESSGNHSTRKKSGSKLQEDIGSKGLHGLRHYQRFGNLFDCRNTNHENSSSGHHTQ